MITCDWWGAFFLVTYCVIATVAGCWAVDRCTGVKAALERSNKYDKKGRLSLEDDSSDREV